MISRLGLGRLFRAACVGALSTLLVACQVPEVDRAGVPDDLEATYSIGPRSAIAPEFGANGHVLFQLGQPRCTNLADVFGPSDCRTGVSRSVLSTGDIWEPGQQYLFTFEFRLDPEMLRRTGPVTLARWQAADRASSPLFELTADARNGASILGRQCATTDDLGDWTRFWMRILWADDQTGYIEVRCGGAVQIHNSPVIFAASNVPTGCRRARPCSTPARAFNLQLGLIGTSRAAARGATVEMRRIAERRLYVVFDRTEAF